jgi:hypothetical protein
MSGPWRRTAGRRRSGSTSRPGETAPYLTGVTVSEQLEAIAARLLSVDPWIRVRVNEFHRLGTRETARDLLRPRRVEMVRYRHVLSRVGITDLVVP